MMHRDWATFDVARHHLIIFRRESLNPTFLFLFSWTENSTETFKLWSTTGCCWRVTVSVSVTQLPILALTLTLSLPSRKPRMRLLRSSTKPTVTNWKRLRVTPFDRPSRIRSIESSTTLVTRLAPLQRDLSPSSTVSRSWSSPGPKDQILTSHRYLRNFSHQQSTVGVQNPEVWKPGLSEIRTFVS